MNLMESTLGTVKIANRLTHLRAIADQRNHTEIPEPKDVKNDLPQMVLIGNNNDILSAFREQLSNDFNLTSCISDSRFIYWNKLYSAHVIIVSLDVKGLQIAQLIKNNSSTSCIPLIFLTTEDNYLNERKGVKLGAVDIISVPVNFYILKFKVLNILKHLHLSQNEVVDASPLYNVKDDDFICRIRAVIQEHIDDTDLNVKKLSRLLSLSPNYVYRRIKRKTGLTMKRFILIERLKVSAVLLKESDKNVSEVAYMVGFESPGYFSRCFKGYYQCSPKDFKDDESILHYSID
ncbi:helix-turn-helix domain-containing protein [Carboxylicivirga linearis]|uniref:Helix-turn-helix domain-containing protein n=1 Tax=Carboxylicivirga linearis TaxID=1628157 RepID=A0ABS5JV01_9BACT|nr:helix-turn-helix domain-containing protein [Carboxylicivirga linearis]MBS2098697.1 helix-turn-helix domain-containing protein [Carboxylicivirga linearis]